MVSRRPGSGGHGMHCGPVQSGLVASS
jgi:hypothetical protein